MSSSYLSGRSGTSEIFLISSPILYFIVFHRISLYVTYEKLASNSFAFLICKYSGASSRRRSKTCWILRSTFCAQLVFTVCVRKRLTARGAVLTKPKSVSVRVVHRRIRRRVPGMNSSLR